MASNPVPNSYPSLLVQLTEAYEGATNLGASIPLLINTAALIGTDRVALIAAQDEYRTARSAVVPLSAARRAAVDAAYEFCLKTRDVLANYLGRTFTEAWLAAGWVDTLAIPQSYEGLYELSLTLSSYLAAHAAQENEELGVTAAAASTVATSLNSTNTAVLNAEALAATKRAVRSAKWTAARKRLSGLCKELSQRLEPLDPRWRQFGFNMPGAATVPEVPRNVVVTPLPGARLQVACDASPNATLYRFYLQRPIVDPEPLFAGHSAEPLFVTEALLAAQLYEVYVSAVNEGAESDLSDPVNATPVLAAAA